MKQKAFIFKAGICLVALGFVLYQHIDEQNKITALKIALPKAMRELKFLKGEAMHLRYQIEQFESPENLLSLAKKREFAHLQYPLAKEIITMSEGPYLLEDEQVVSRGRSKASISFASIPKK